MNEDLTIVNNSIPEDQNKKNQLDRLAAQRYLYTKAKSLLAIQLTLTGLCPFVWSIIAILFPVVKIYAATWGIGILLLDVLVLDQSQKFLKKKATRIQELFDCDLLDIEWKDIKTGSRPEAESVFEAAKKFKRLDPDCSTLKNWYPPTVGQLPLHIARIICQRANCWWDGKLRRRYATWIMGILSVLLLITIIVGIAKGVTLENFILGIIFPITPLFVLGVREYLRQTESANTADSLRTHAENLWRKAIEKELLPDHLKHECRLLQDEIFDHRRNSPLIFNWVYRLLRIEHEEQMNVAADELVREALHKV
jgi:hypothetical protein